jgi:hypothetical protein
MNFEFQHRSFSSLFDTGIRRSILKISSNFMTYKSRRCLRAEFWLDIFNKIEVLFKLQKVLNFLYFF